METSVEQHVPTISAELSSVYLGDTRLCRRLHRVVDAIARTPNASLPTIFTGGAALEATYRLLGNERVTMARVLAPHHEATCERAQREGSILAVHDTTEFEFEGESERKGLGPVSGGQGFFAHVALAVTADARRRPLGALGLIPVLRAPKPKPKRAPVKKGGSAAEKTAKKAPKKVSWRVKYDDPTKESLRWLDLVEQVETQVAGRAEILHVMDREADDYALLALLSAGLRFVLRCKYNRRIAPETPGEATRKLDDALAEAPYLLERTVKMSARNNDAKAPKARRLHPTRAMRNATLHTSATRVTLVRPQGLPTTLPAKLTLHVVHVHEVDAPEGEKPVSWVLYTSEPVTTKEDVERVVDTYRARWVIEDYFMALKTGCSFEKRQLESAHSLLNLLALCVPIAWRLLLLRNLARDEPDAPGSEVLPPSQLEVLNAVSTKKLPANPTARDVFLAVAALGGHIKNNGDPGWRVLARGYEHLLTLEQGWLIARATPSSTASVNPRSPKR